MINAFLLLSTSTSKETPACSRKRLTAARRHAWVAAAATAVTAATAAATAQEQTDKPSINEREE